MTLSAIEKEVVEAWNGLRWDESLSPSDVKQMHEFLRTFVARVAEETFTEVMPKKLSDEEAGDQLLIKISHNAAVSQMQQNFKKFTEKV